MSESNDPWDLPSYDAFSRPQPAAQPPNYSSSAASWNPSAAPSTASWNTNATPSAVSWNPSAPPSAQFGNNKIILDDDFDVFNTRSLPGSGQLALASFSLCFLTLFLSCVVLFVCSTCVMLCKVVCVCGGCVASNTIQPLSTANTTATKDSTGILDLVDFDNLLSPQNSEFKVFTVT